MRTKNEIRIVKLFDNPLGRWYFDVPKGKKIYLITRGSVHYYTGEIAKNGLPIICARQNIGARNTFINWLETWKPIHLCWFYIKMGWQIPKYFIGADSGALSPGTVAYVVKGTQIWNNMDRAKTDDGITADGRVGNND